MQEAILRKDGRELRAGLRPVKGRLLLQFSKDLPKPPGGFLIRDKGLYLLFGHIPDGGQKGRH